MQHGTDLQVGFLKTRYAIGIDPGVHNGMAIYCRQEKQLVAVNSLPLHELFEVLKSYAKISEVFIENPNTYIPFKNTNQSARLQGAGAVKQTYKHITEFLEAHEIPFTATRLQGNIKKTDKATFQKLTGYLKPTNQHGRDAAFLCFQR